MSDLATVRAQVKGWEREFKLKNGRGPDVHDIKNNPAIAVKYKLYKQLNKAVTAGPEPLASSSKVQPQQPSARLLPSTRTTVETTAPLTSFNPFSPQKKATVRPLPSGASKPSVSNPFATPSKPKAKRTFTPQSPTSNANSLFGETAMPSAVSRARKRLRGEAVSPSPAKEKRRRLVPEAESIDEDDVFTDAGNSSFVDDSPVKGSSFKLLFTESVIATSKTLFPPPTNSSALSLEDNDDDHTWPRVKSERLFFPSTSGRPMRDLSSSRELHTRMSADRELIVSQASRKRALSISDSEHTEDMLNPRVPILVPPSPPPADTSKRPIGPYKGKGKAGKVDRKKAKLTLPQSDEDEEEDDNIQVVVRSLARPSLTAHSSDGDGDDVFISHSKRPDDLEHVELERFEVDLPDRLRQVLAFSPNQSRVRIQERRVVDRLLYGRRTEQYDASKGGEIWDVGEPEEGEQVEDEEDWEGEAVPWEAAEL